MQTWYLHVVKITGNMHQHFVDVLSFNALGIEKI